MLQLTAKAIKATLVLNVAVVAATNVIGDTAIFTIAGDDQKSTGKFNGKTARPVAALVREHGPDNVAVIAQGKLVNSKLEEAGITGPTARAEARGRRGVMRPHSDPARRGL